MNGLLSMFPFHDELLADLNQLMTCPVSPRARRRLLYRLPHQVHGRPPFCHRGDVQGVLGHTPLPVLHAAQLLRFRLCCLLPAKSFSGVVLTLRFALFLHAQLICRLVKMGWFDVDAKDTHVMRDIVTRIGHFLNVRRGVRMTCVGRHAGPLVCQSALPPISLRCAQSPFFLTHGVDDVVRSATDNRATLHRWGANPAAARE